MENLHVTIRIASRLLAWRRRARARRVDALATMLDELVRKTFFAIRVSNRDAAVAGGLLGAARKLPILVGRLVLQQWRSARARCPRSAALPAPSTSSTVAAQPQPALALAPPPPPSQPPPSALAAAARATLDACELQDDRGSKRDALTRTPPRPAAPPKPPLPAEPRKKTRGGGARLCIRRRRPSRRRTATAHRHRLPRRRPRRRRPQPSLCLRRAPGHAHRLPTLPVAAPPHPRRPHWRPPSRCTPPSLPAAGTVPATPTHPIPSPHIHHLPAANSPPHTSTAPPHRAYPARQRHRTRASPTTPLSP